MQSVMTYGLALVSLVAMGVFVVGTFGANLKYMHARMMLVNLLRTNPYQAEVTCRSMKGTFFDGIGAALKTGGMMGTRDPGVVAQATKPAYDAAASQASIKWKLMFGKAKLAGMGALGALALPMTSGKNPPVAIIIISLLALAGLGWIFLRKMEVDASIIRARADVLPEVERAIVDGRYVSQPPPQGR